jgi:tetratricopeptide (TPR) repeat protein
VIALLFLAAGALSDDAAFVEGKQLYEQSEYEQAIFRFQAASLETQHTDAERAQVLVWLGLAYAGFGDAASSRRAFADALRIDPSSPLPVEVSPKVETEFNAVRDEVARAPRRPSGAAARPPPGTKPASKPDAQGAHGGSVMPWVGLGVGALGVVCLAAGGVAAILAVQNNAVVQDLETFQDDAYAAQNARDVQTVVAAVAIPAGVLLAGGGIALFVLPAE